MIIMMLIVGDFGGVPKGSRSSNPPGGCSGVGVLVVDNGSSGRAQKTGRQRGLHPKQLDWENRANRPSIGVISMLTLLGLIAERFFRADSQALISHVTLLSGFSTEIRPSHTESFPQGTKMRVDSFLFHQSYYWQHVKPMTSIRGSPSSLWPGLCSTLA